MASSNLFLGNEAMWLKLAESENDYAIFFIKNWIPFNAWYYNLHRDLNLNSDREHLEKLKTDGNQIREKIKALLNSNTSEGQNFRNYLAQLHESLENNTISTQGQRICFTDLHFRKNVSDQTNITNQSVRYFVQYNSTSKKYMVIVEKPKLKKNKTQFQNNSVGDIEQLKKEIQNSKLDTTQQQFLLQCFKDTMPNRKESILIRKSKHCIEIGKYCFVNDAEIIAQAIIEVLYNLRCSLFHGELVPNPNNLTVYEHAFQILRILIKSLKN